MMRVLILLGLVALLSGCETFHGDARYRPAMHNVREIKELHTTINVHSFTEEKQDSQNLNCRMAGPLSVTGDKSFARFIEDAFTDEIDMAGAYSKTAPNILKGTIHSVKFSSMSPANWEIRATFDLNGHAIPITAVYAFDSSFMAMTACNIAARNFMNVVEKLIEETLHNPSFKAHLKH